MYRLRFWKKVRGLSLRCPLPSPRADPCPCVLELFSRLCAARGIAFAVCICVFGLPLLARTPHHFPQRMRFIILALLLLLLACVVFARR